MEKMVEIQTEGGLLRGMIHYPRGGMELEGTDTRGSEPLRSERYPVIVAFHGFEGTRMGSSSFFVALSRTLAKAGFASVRFDFLGSGESEGEFSDMTISRELEDARRILEWTARQPGIDGKRTALLGHSMGGSITGVLAGLMEEGKIEIEGIEVKTLALLAPAGEIRDRIDEEMAARGLRIKVDSPEFWSLPFPIPVRGGLIGRAFFDDLRRYDVMRQSASVPQAGPPRPGRRRPHGPALGQRGLRLEDGGLRPPHDPRGRPQLQRPRREGQALPISS